LASTIEVRFDALAQEHTELVCGMNLAIMTGVTEQLQETSLVARQEPTPGRCCVVLVAHDDREAGVDAEDRRFQ
jgi:predicted ArsR family transcriptional regulator